MFTDVDDDAVVFDPNMENVFDAIPLKLLFMKFVACDDDENNDEVADEVVAVTVVAEKFLLAIGVGVTGTVDDIVVVAIVVAVYPPVIVVALIMLLLFRALAFGNTDVVIDLLTNGVIVLYGAVVWSPNVK